MTEELKSRNEKDLPKILWGITSSGDELLNTINLMLDLKSWGIFDIEVMTSREALFVLKYYNCWNFLKDNFSTIYLEKGPNAPFLGGPIQRRRYKFLIIMPVTGNTMAKIAHGIADSLISNCVALALKARVKVYLFPTDQEGVGEETVLADGSTLKLYPRDIDLENVAKVSRMRDITIFRSLSEARVFLEKQQHDHKL
ncbi:MAG: flavoprotein [Promethearchaeota archaeon]